jgi:hypothetical protein
MLPKVQELNSFAKIAAEPTTIEDLTDEYFEAFSVILLTECTEDQAVRINNICRQRNPNCSFFWSDMFGERAYSTRTSVQSSRTKRTNSQAAATPLP